MNFLPDMNQPARDAASAELQSLNTEFDRQSADLNLQLGSLGTQRENTLSSFGTQLKGVQTQVAQSKQNSQTQTETNTQDALSTAQGVERSNRNKLRALGILNSSAAGDILSRPLNEYDKQRATMLAAHQQRSTELDSFLDQKTAEHADSVRQIEIQYTDLVGKIQNDLRFNDRQRGDAIRSANAALSQRLAEIQQAQFNYATQVDTMKKNLASQIASVNNYQVPGFNAGAFVNSQLGATPNAQQPQGFAVAQEDPRKKLLSGFA